jgi:hypothetical protein
MGSNDLTISFLVDQTPAEAFAAINNVRAWWSGNIEGITDTLNEEWTYRYKDMHSSRQRVTQLVPGKQVVWTVLDADLSFVKDRGEWKGTKIVFDITKKGEKTEVRFTHAGLVPAHECFEACSEAWGFYIRGSLKKLIASGHGKPNRKERARALSTQVRRQRR